MATSWEFISGQKKHTQDATMLVTLMKDIGLGRKPVKCLDIGCGDGIIAHDLIKLKKATQVVGIEISKAAIEIARKNLAPHEGRIELHHISAQKFLKNPKWNEAFDCVVINPPFFKKGSGLQNKTKLDQMARYEEALSVKTWVKGGAKVLRSGGELYCVFPTERLAELITELKKVKLEPKNIWWFKQDLKSRRFFLRAVKNGKSGLVVNRNWET